MKGKILVLSLIAIAFCIMPTQSTLSYLTDSEMEDVSYTIGTIKIRARTVRNNCENIPYQSTCIESVSFRNIGDTDAYVRSEIWIPADRLQLNDASEPLLYSLELEPSSEFTAGEPETVTKDDTEYIVYRFARSDVLESNASSGSVKIKLTNHQIASLTSGDLNAEECTGANSSCVTTSDITASLKDAGVKVYTQAIQAQGFSSAVEAFNKLDN